jgi:Tol biopolymer transport system component
MYKYTVLAILLLSSCTQKEVTQETALITFNAAESKKLIREGEKHFKQVKMLTNGGENAEAYFSFDFKKIIFQARRNGAEFDAIYSMTLDGKEQKMISSGEGVTTCSYFMPDGKSFVYASTHDGKQKLVKPDRALGYVWPLYSDFDIFHAEYPSGKIIKKLTNSDRYDAEATVSPLGDKIVFTSLRDGDMEIYSMNLDGSDQKRLTNLPGFDGGPFYSWDGKKILFRGSHPTDKAELQKQKDLQDKNLMTPVDLDLYIMDADGSNLKRLTDNKSANFGPFFHPNNKDIIFSSNYKSKSGHSFELWMTDTTGTKMEQITNEGSFNGFPMFTKDGKHLVFGSNRNNAKGSRDTNVFIAEWID